MSNETTAQASGSPASPCSACGGTGERLNVSDWPSRREPCPECTGKYVPQEEEITRLRNILAEIDEELYGDIPPLGYEPDRAETIRAMKLLSKPNTSVPEAKPEGR